MTTAIPNDVPELQNYIATDVNDKVDALKLVADSMAQQRQAANQALIFHPLNLSVGVGILAVVSRTLFEYGYDTITVFTTGVGIVMALFAACRIFTQKYINAAESLNMDFVDKSDVFITKFGNEVIGAAIVEWQSPDSKAKRSKRASQGVIKAWTVRMRFRNKSVGSGLLEDAVAEARKKGAESLVFADDHANSLRPINKMYNGAMDKRDEKSRALLANLWEEHGKKK